MGENGQVWFDIGSATVNSDRALGGAWVLEQLWEKLGIRATLARLLADRHPEDMAELSNAQR
ncbi:MAG: hypothetical protein VB144_10280 [Clostridia bacterium]|nr:hypothetical protein [Clostridia bacterium]